jgi:hypothetical protein
MFTLLHGFFAGMMVEGGCRWGYDPIWLSPHDVLEGKGYTEKQI